MLNRLVNQHLQADDGGVAPALQDSTVRGDVSGRKGNLDKCRKKERGRELSASEDSILGPAPYSGSSAT